jgi:hypothetical protein
MRPSDELPRIRRVELNAQDVVAAIFSNVSFPVTALRLSPGERGGVGQTVTSYGFAYAMAQTKKDTCGLAASPGTCPTPRPTS